MFCFTFQWYKLLESHGFLKVLSCSGILIATEKLSVQIMSYFLFSPVLLLSPPPNVGWKILRPLRHSGFFTRYHRLCLVTEKSFIFLLTLKLNILFNFFCINHTGKPIFFLI